MVSESQLPAASALLDYLPAIYHGNEFLGRFLRVFEDLHEPIRRDAATLPTYFNPAVAPESVLGFLAGWVGAEYPDGTPDRGRRALVRNAIPLYRWRGTKRGLADALRLVTGQQCAVYDASDGLTIGPGVGVGSAARLGTAEPFTITVRLECKRGEVDETLLNSILTSYCPAHVRSTVEYAGD